MHLHTEQGNEVLYCKTRRVVRCRGIAAHIMVKMVITEQPAAQWGNGHSHTPQSVSGNHRHSPQTALRQQNSPDACIIAGIIKLYTGMIFSIPHHPLLRDRALLR